MAGRNKLSAKTVEAFFADKTGAKGSIYDGGGLSFCRPNSSIFTYTAPDGRRRDMGLGPFVSLAQSRAQRDKAEAKLRDGFDPIEARREKRQAAKVAATTFADVAADWLVKEEPAKWSKKHRVEVERIIALASAAFGSTPVAKIDDDKVEKFLTPIWNDTRVFGERCRAKIHDVLNFAKGGKLRSGDNPAAWAGGLKGRLPKRRTATDAVHLAAPSYDEIPSIMARLEAAETVGAAALRFMILTAGRSMEVLAAEWCEVDMQQRLWVVPANRMKAGKPHEVPLSTGAMKILRHMAAVRIGKYVFPGRRANRLCAPNVSYNALKRLDIVDKDGNPATVHGTVRSTFRDWAGDRTGFRREVSEACLAHAIGDSSEQAYRRGSALEKRRELMELWAAFCAGPATPIMAGDALVAAWFDRQAAIMDENAEANAAKLAFVGDNFMAAWNEYVAGQEYPAAVEAALPNVIAFRKAH
jgi:integrase